LRGFGDRGSSCSREERDLAFWCLDDVEFRASTLEKLIEERIGRERIIGLVGGLGGDGESRGTDEREEDGE
jgi:hypothetical protein